MSGSARGNQLGFEVIGQPGTYAGILRANQSGWEVCGALITTSNARANQSAFEVCGAQPNGMRANQVGWEVCGPAALDAAFVVTSSGNVLMDTAGHVSLGDRATGLVDSGAWMRVRNLARWIVGEESTCAFTDFGQVTAIGLLTLVMSFATFEVQVGTCAFGSTTVATTAIVLGNGSDSALLSVTGTFSADDTSSVTLGTTPDGTGPAALIIGEGATLALVDIDFSLIGTLALENVTLERTGAAPGDSLSSTGYVLADFTFVQYPGGVFFKDASYAPTPVSWLWTFGDSVESGLQNPIHLYSAPGEHVVTLTIASPNGSSTITRTITVT